MTIRFFGWDRHHHYNQQDVFLVAQTSHWTLSLVADANLRCSVGMTGVGIVFAWIPAP
jgi:hypothetical protein